MLTGVCRLSNGLQKEELREESQSFDVVIHRGAGDTSPPGTKLTTARLVLPLEKSWDTFAKWCVGQTLGSPSSATKQSSNNTYLYTAPIQIWNNGALQKTYQNRVSVRTSDWVIVTSYISRT